MNEPSSDTQMQSVNPAVSAFLAFLNTGGEEAMKQSSDTWRMFKPEDGFMFDPKSPFYFQQYPTAQLYKKALVFFESGRAILESFQKEIVETEEDCMFLRPAFQDCVYGHICENSMFPKDIRVNAAPYVDQYLKLKPDDYMVRYLQFMILSRSSFIEEKSDISDYEKNKLVIRTGEQLADKLKSCKTRSPELLAIRIDLYYILGSRYSATGQKVRALDSFEKSYKLDKNNYRALYGVAYHNMEIEPQKAKSLFNEYLQIAPKCDKQYPNAYYMLASMHIIEQNMDEVFRYQKMAEQAEKERLPFLQPVVLPQKDAVQLLTKFKPQLRTGHKIRNAVDFPVD